MIDTVSIARQLRESGLTLEQSEGIAMQMGELMRSNLATEEGLIKTELKLQKEIEEVKKEIKTLEANIQKDIRQFSTTNIRWVAGMLIGQTALIATLVKVLG